MAFSDQLTAALAGGFVGTAVSQVIAVWVARKKSAEDERNERRRLAVAAHDRRLDALATLIGDMRVYADQVIDLHTAYVEHRDLLCGDTWKGPYATDEARERGARELNELRKITHRAGTPVPVQAERYGSLPKEVLGQALPLGAFLTRWERRMASYATQSTTGYTDVTATTLGELREDMVWEIWALRTYEEERKQATIEHRDPPAFKRPLRWITVKRFEQGWDLQIEGHDVLDPLGRGLEDQALLASGDSNSS